MKKLKIKTNKKKEVIDITNKVQKVLVEESSTCNLLLTHTTAALTTADLDPGTDLDMLDAFEEIMPNLDYRHPHNPEHAPDHILSSIIGTSLSLPVENGELLLGAWQRIVLIELDGPRERTVIVF
ncbi:MAG: secondary thiamine-phosphate synthase enzyme YjbQ [Candidatus Spechtbacterales bacterium]|nr:secondary thiamine-phosphate synthase enzyme YjbQ [Candidatus Spechtbacterales bacterium]